MPARGRGDSSGEVAVGRRQDAWSFVADRGSRRTVKAPSGPGGWVASTATEEAGPGSMKPDR